MIFFRKSLRVPRGGLKKSKIFTGTYDTQYLAEALLD